MSRLTKVRDLTGWQGKVWLVKDTETGDHYAISRAYTLDRGDETMIFACDEDGENVNWTDLWAGYGVGHEHAMNDFGSGLPLEGYVVADDTPELEA